MLHLCLRISDSLSFVEVNGNNTHTVYITGSVFTDKLTYSAATNVDIDGSIDLANTATTSSLISLGSYGGSLTVAGDIVGESDQIVISSLNDIVSGIAAAIEEQSVTVSSNAENMKQAATGLVEVSKSTAASNDQINSIAGSIDAFSQSSGESCFAETGWKWQNVLGTRDSRRDRNPVI